MRPRTATALAALALVLTGCTSVTARTDGPSADDLVKAATQVLTDECLQRQGLAPPRPGQQVTAVEQQQVSDALFGKGPAEMTLRLSTGYVVRAHTDGCLAAANERLYGDQRLWFHSSVIVNNLRPEASHDGVTLAVVRARHRAELTEWSRLRAHATEQAASLLQEEQVQERAQKPQHQPSRGTAQK
ncbi:hypothetical protein [Streptomyces sp. cg36]|uniref:hypothetical protein n=1 Tax=Streptomyces sp. cg36 TaxID=3238798 RepID=UPI0034E1DBDA